MDCSLISKKLRGLNENCQKLEFPGIIFLKETRGPRAASVHGGPWSPSRRRLAGERPKQRPRAWNLTAVEGKGRGDGGEPHQLQECHTPFREIGNEASIRVPRMFKSHAWQQYDKQMQWY